MPFINVKITRDGATAESKARCIAAVTEAVATTLKKNPQSVLVIIEELETDNWGVGGESVTERRRKKEAQ